MTCLFHKKPYDRSYHKISSFSASKVNFTIVGVRDRAGLVGVEADEEGEAAAENAEGKLVVDDAASTPRGTPETPEMEAGAESVLESSGAAIRVN